VPGLSTKLEKIVDLRIFSECFCGPHMLRGPLIAHPWPSSFFYETKQWHRWVSVNVA